MPGLSSHLLQTTELVIIPLSVDPAVPILPNSTQNTRQFTRFHGRGRTPCGRGFTPRRQINEATEFPEAKSNEKSDLDTVRFMEAYRLSNNSPETSLK